ncbi:subtilisin-like protease 8 [Rhizoctonia solani]|uniref:Subtilisin-like protease 8 n=1 Tax=Rhizoctonia solani TaxID=456999 RepID=A0A8H8STS0_9AGAM|nr:subtilisin-like protease 8 [Rhizoctonia solani]QRW17399.1 subtilisin-like protease 8 [Rhizoctonia solani]
MRTALLVSALAFVAPVFGAPTGTVVPIAKRAGPVVPDSYIVRLKGDTSKSLFFALLDPIFKAASSGIIHDYRDCGNYPEVALKLSGDALAFVQRMKEVESIEQDEMIFLPEYEEVTGLNIASHTNAERHRRHDTLAGRAYESSKRGEGVNIYGIDTGINTNHVCFEGRAVFGKSFVEGEGEGDGNGHGTPGKGFGPAIYAKVIAVKVLSSMGSGSTSGVIAGVCWAYSDFKAKGVSSVAIMSLGGPLSPPLDRAVKNAIDGGMHFSIAAGNSDLPADLFSPARVESANTVGAVDSNNHKASFSNYGPSVDVWYSGVNVTSAWITSNDATRVLSGTSMAAPGVAGITACMLSKCPSLNKPSIMSEELRKHAVVQAKFSNATQADLTPNKGVAQLWDCSY